MGLLTKIYAIIASVASNLISLIGMIWHCFSVIICYVIFLDGNYVVPNIIIWIISLLLACACFECSFDMRKSAKNAEHKFQRDEFNECANSFFHYGLIIILSSRLILMHFASS